eukprot:1458097-Karenia_brevis.AAC.1
MFDEKAGIRIVSPRMCPHDWNFEKVEEFRPQDGCLGIWRCTATNSILKGQRIIIKENNPWRLTLVLTFDVTHIDNNSSHARCSLNNMGGDVVASSVAQKGNMVYNEVLALVSSLSMEMRMNKIKV